MAPYGSPAVRRRRLVAEAKGKQRSDGILLVLWAADSGFYQSPETAGLHVIFIARVWFDSLSHKYIYIYLDTPTNSRIFLYLYYFLHCRIIVKPSKLRNNISCSNQKSVKQIKIYVIFEILQSSHPLPWWQLCTLLAFSQPFQVTISWSWLRKCQECHLECI